MKSLLISDNKDTIVGLRLSGISGVLAETKEEIMVNFDKAVKDKNIGIVIITENIFEMMKDKVVEVKRSGDIPLIVTIPNREGLRDKNFIMKYVKESIGIKI